MKKPHAIIQLILALSLALSACSDKNKSQKSIENTQKIAFDSALIDFNPENYKDEEIVFYNLFSPVEFTYLITENNSYYNSLLINPINNITKYNSSDKYALNLGVYGADLSYLWMFNQTQQALSYRSAIQRLTDLMEIPRTFVDFTYETAEGQSQYFDSLVVFAKKSYVTADNFLKQTGRPHSAALILLGGWIETMYIATNMYEKPDANLLSRIAIQRYSLNSLNSLLMNYQDKVDVKEYLLLLRKLKKVYDSQNIHITPDNLVIDTVSKQIKLRNSQIETLSYEQFKEIQLITNQIRNHIID